MKAKDIVIGEDYAVGTRDYAAKRRVEKVEKGHTRVYSGARWDFRGHPSKEMILAHFSDGGVATLGQVVCTWAEWEVRRAAAHDAATVAKAARVARIAPVNEALAVHGIVEPFRYRDEATFTIDEIEKLLGLHTPADDEELTR